MNRTIIVINRINPASLIIGVGAYLKMKDRGEDVELYDIRDPWTSRLVDVDDKICFIECGSSKCIKKYISSIRYSKSILDSFVYINRNTCVDMFDKVSEMFDFSEIFKWRVALDNFLDQRVRLTANELYPVYEMFNFCDMYYSHRHHSWEDYRVLCSNSIWTNEEVRKYQKDLTYSTKELETLYLSTCLAGKHAKLMTSTGVRVLRVMRLCSMVSTIDWIHVSMGCHGPLIYSSCNELIGVFDIPQAIWVK